MSKNKKKIHNVGIYKEDEGLYIDDNNYLFKYYNSDKDVEVVGIVVNNKPRMLTPKEVDVIESQHFKVNTKYNFN